MPHDESNRAMLAGIAETESVHSPMDRAVDTPGPLGAAALLDSRPAPSDLLSDRFVLERQVGSGGMGVVHRATDLVTRQAVAIKMMARPGPSEASRFQREVAVLAELSHPAIVRYIAHGTTPQGAPFLAMEWLEGEDLSRRLARAALTVEESLSLVRRACEGIASAHARGVVHRDIKPSNLFLLNGDPASVKVIDFGIARQGACTRPLTQSGALLGTVGYMSPEQAMGPRDVDARADVFALGCVLFECLTGRAAFAGQNPLAVWAKVLHEEPPRIAELRPELGGGLDALVASMMAKSANERPKDASAVLCALTELRCESGGVPSAPGASSGLTRSEQKVVSVIMGKPWPRFTRPSEPFTGDQADVELGHIRQLTSHFGAEPVALRDGGLLVVLSGRGPASDQASQAATCALGLRHLQPALCLGVATGLAQTAGRIPMGAVIDRAASLLARTNDLEPEIAVDELTARLLDPAFQVRREGARLLLVGQRTDFEATRLLMGKPTPFVGRDRELGFLDLTLRECSEDGVARAVLLTGPAGHGKSRLRQEFLAAARQRSGLRILVARADPIGAGSAFLLVRQLVRSAAGLSETEAATSQQNKLIAYLAERFKEADALRIAEFLGELIGIPFHRSPSPTLRSARNDQAIMGAWLRRSFAEWLAAECAARPLLLVLEDLHWGDLPSVTYLGEGLRALSARPLMVLALARPEVHDTFPSLWAATNVQEVSLGGLTLRAAERLIRAALGETTADDTVAGIIERAEGSPFYLEELIRHVADGGGDTLPETVLSLVESRLERLEMEARRIVRAASLFGEVFWQGGVVAVLGASEDEGDVGDWLATLVDREVFSVAPESRFHGQPEFAFRHSLVRAAAYAMLTDADRSSGHALAGEWLERAGEGDALTLADHFERGASLPRALPWILKAAEAAWDGGNIGAAIALAERGLACGPNDTQRGLFRRVQASALVQHGHWPRVLELAKEAMGLLSVGSTSWFSCSALVFNAGMFLGDRSITVPALQSILAVAVRPEPSGAYAWAIHQTCVGLTSMGQFDLARGLLERAEAIGQAEFDPEPAFVLRLHLARAYLQLVSGEPGLALVTISPARALAERTGDSWGRAAAGTFLLWALAELGRCAGAEAVARDVQAFSEWSFWIDHSALGLAWAMVMVGRAPEAIGPLQTLLDRPEPAFTTRARALLAHALVEVEDLDGALREAMKVVTEVTASPSTQAVAFAAIARLELHRSRPLEALEFADRGLRAYASSWRFSATASNLQVARAEALHTLGRTELAHSTIREASQRILHVAATLEDPELRDSYLTNIESNARMLRLATEWLGAGSK